MTTLFVVTWYEEDMEGTFRETVGIASTPERALEIQREHIRLSLKKRSAANPRCKTCGYPAGMHDPDSEARRQLEEYAKRVNKKPNIDNLIACSYVAPDPVTQLRPGEGYEIDEMEVDALPKEEA